MKQTEVTGALEKDIAPDSNVDWGNWDYNFINNTFTCNNTLRQWFGLDEVDASTINNGIRAIHINDRERIAEAINTAMDFNLGGSYNEKYTLIHPVTLQQKMVHAKGQVYFNSNKVAYRFKGTVQDITEANDNRNTKNKQGDLTLLKFMVNNVSDFICIADLSYTPTYINKEGLKSAGLSEDIPLATLQLEDFFFTEDKKFILNDFLVSVLETGKGETEIRFKNFATGEPLWMLYHVTLLCNEDNEPVGYAGIGKNITKRILAEHKLKESEERFRTMAEASGILIVMSDDIANITYINQASVDFTGRKMEDLMLHGWMDLVHPEDREVLIKLFTDAVLKKQHFSSEIRVMNYNKDYRWLLVKASPYNNTDGSFAGFISSLVDITANTEYRKKLEESELYLKKLTDSVPAIIWITDANGSCTYLNKCWYEYTAQTKQENGSLGWFDAMHPEDGAKTEAIFFTANKNRIQYVANYRLKFRTGGYRWVIDNGSPKFSASGEYEGMIGTVVDVHEEKLAEQKLRVNEEKLKGAVAAVQGIVWTNNALGEMEGEQPAWEALTGQTTAEYQGFGWANVVHPDDAQPTIDAWRKALAAKSTFTFEHRLKTKNQSWRYFSIRAIPLLSNDEEITEWVGVHTDITERRESEIALRLSEEKFSTLADNMENLAWIANGEGWIYWYNQRWYEFTGTTFDEMQGWGWQKVHHPDYVDEMVLTASQKWKTKESFEATFPLRRFDGEYRWFLTKCRPVSDENGKVVRWFGTNTDITEQREKQAQLEYSKALLEAHNEANIDGLLLVDAQGKILSYNKQFIEIWKIPKYIVDAKDDEAAFSFAAAQLVNPAQLINKSKYLYDETTITSVDELAFKDGRIIEQHGYPVIAENGTYYAWSRTFKDITIAKKAELRLRQSEENFRQLAELIPEKITNSDKHGHVTYYNQSWINYMGMPISELEQKHWRTFIHEEDYPEMSLRWHQSLRTARDFEMELRVKNKDGIYKWHLNRVVAVKDKSGEVTRWIGSLTEIQKIKEEEKRKDDFLKMASHELKTPITSIKGYVQFLLNIVSNPMLEANPALEPVKSSLSRIDHQIVRLTRLITEMLDLSRIESGKLELQQQVFNLNQLVQETVQDILHTSTTHIINIEETCTCSVFGDRDRLGQVLINFVNNAIKYSPASKLINIKIFNTDRNNVAVSVQDFGIGIIKENQPKIFERFYRVEGKREETFSGFGIGLFIANEIVQRHNGNIEVQSEILKGSIFTFTIPLQQ